MVLVHFRQVIHRPSSIHPCQDLSLLYMRQIVSVTECPWDSPLDFSVKWCAVCRVCVSLLDTLVLRFVHFVSRHSNVIFHCFVVVGSLTCELVFSMLCDSLFDVMGSLFKLTSISGCWLDCLPISRVRQTVNQQLVVCYCSLMILYLSSSGCDVICGKSARREQTQQVLC